MIRHPFSHIKRFVDSYDVIMLTKEDHAQSDEDIARITGAKNIASLHQVHGAEVIIVTEPTSRYVQADALITNMPHLSLTVRTADCQNIVLFDPVKKVLALVHAGWKGMRQRILSHTVQKMKEEFDVHPSDLLAAAGPSLCKRCAEFTDPQAEAPELSEFFDGRHIDLQAAADTELRSLGVMHIERSPDCTRCKPQKYWTYRGGDREAVESGFCNVLVATLL